MIKISCLVISGHSLLLPGRSRLFRRSVLCRIYSCDDISSLLEIAPRNLRVCRWCRGTGTRKQKKSVRKCQECQDGLIRSVSSTIEVVPKVAIVGAGIAGLALALALEQRNIGSIIFERDDHFFARKPGYGLTLQQGGKALRKLGVLDIVRDCGIWTSRHIHFNALSGNILGEHGAGVIHANSQKKKYAAIHIPRQALRAILLSQLVTTQVHWGSTLSALLPETIDLIVGADGIRSRIRNQIFHDELRPSNLTCILGRLPTTEAIRSLQVFEFVDGQARLYAMPFDDHSVMWQLSFPNKAINTQDLSFSQTARRVVKDWTQLARDLIQNTPDEALTGYPLFDRHCFPERNTTIITNEEGYYYTLVGDSAHPMLPFKAQGANQALLDSLSLAHHLYSPRSPTYFTPFEELPGTLLEYEQEMRLRANKKVSASRTAGCLLHSPAATIKATGQRLTRAAVAKLATTTI